MKEKQRILLHSCCGPCSTACIERLAEEYAISLFFYNPNITEEEEYHKRKAAQLQFLEEYNREKEAEDQVIFLEGPYDEGRFRELCRGLEREPEGGARCTVCFRMRLAESAKKAEELGFDLYTTTLSVSPHKNFPLLCQIGREEAEGKPLSFLEVDFKKKAGFQRSIQLSKEYGLYRQNYCGCVFSKEHRG